MGSITSANAVLTLSIPLLFPTPQQIQGFAPDDAWDFPTIKSVEVLMGVDGLLSAGFVFVPIIQSVTLQADSLSTRVFDTWWTQMQATKNTYQANGLAIVPAISTKFQLVEGYLTGYKPAPAAKKLLQPRQFEITWKGIGPAPI